MKMKTRLLPSLILTVALVAVLAACGGGSNSSVSSDDVATVSGTPVTRTDFNSLMNVAFARYKSQGQATPKPGTAAYSQLKDQAVTFLVQEQELQQEGKKMGVTISQSDIDKQVDLIKKTYYKGSDTKLNAALKKDGITLQELEQYNIAPNLLSQKLQAKVTSDVNVSSADALKYYNANKSSFTTPKTREVRHILVKSKSLGQNIENQVKNGGNFAQLAKKYSKDTGSAKQGGKLCVAHGGSSGACQQTVAPFDKAAFSLKTNEVALVHSVYGWHVIQPIGPVKPAHTQTFKEVESQIQSNLAQQQKQVAWSNWLAKLAKDYKGKVNYQTGYTPATTTAPAATAPAATTTGG
jgi:parvulin-like peptidyl-prolyl isomerase